MSKHKKSAPAKKHNHKTHNPKTGKPHSKKKRKKIADILAKGKEKAMMLLFLPFVVVARAFLKKRHITPGKTPKDILLQVYNETKKKNYGLIPPPEVLVPVDSFGYASASELGVLDQMGYTTEEYGFIPVTPDMIQAVIGFLKNIFDSIGKKKEAADKDIAEGKPVPPEDQLTPEEQEIADKAPEIEKDLADVKEKAAAVDKETEEAAGKEAEKPEGGIALPGGMHLSMPMIAGIVLLLVLIIFMSRK